MHSPGSLVDFKRVEGESVREQWKNALNRASEAIAAPVNTINCLCGLGQVTWIFTAYFLTGEMRGLGGR